MAEPLANPAVSPRIVIIDPDARVRESLTGILCIGGRCLVEGGAGDLPAAVALVASRRPQVAIIDARLTEGPDGESFVAAVRSAMPDICIVAMGRSERVDDQVLGIGVDGYVRKTFRSHELIPAILAACCKPST